VLLGFTAEAAVFTSSLPRLHSDAQVVVGNEGNVCRGGGGA
jgi:hypothetical protein